MTDSTPMQYVFSQSEYESRCNQVRLLYTTHIESTSSPNLKGAIREFYSKSIADGFEMYATLRAEGWTVLPFTSPFATPEILNGFPPYVRLFLIKPEDMQNNDVEVIYAVVKAQYEKDLEAQLEAEVERQITLSIAAAERAKEEQAAKERAAIAEQTRKDYEKSRAALKKRLIQQGKLTEEGVAA